MSEFDLDDLSVVSEQELKANMINDGIAMLDTVKAQIENGFYDAAINTLELAKKYVDGSAHAEGQSVREFKRA